MITEKSYNKDLRKYLRLTIVSGESKEHLKSKKENMYRDYDDRKRVKREVFI